MPEHTPAPTPARSLYGFFMYLFSKTFLTVYCIWAIVPDQYLNYLNIYYFPQKYWSTAVPIQCLVALTLFAFIIYPSANLVLTCAIDSNSTICDKFSTTQIHNRKGLGHKPSFCICTNEKKCMKNHYSATTKEFNDNTVHQLFDIDMRVVSKKLYLRKNKNFF